MSTTIPNIIIPYPTEGVIRSAQLNDTVTPENSVQLAVNMNFDRVGAAQTRPGVSQLSLTNPVTTRGGSITSLGTLNTSSGTRKLFSQVGTDVSVWSGSAWTSVRTTTVSTKARFSQWLNVLYMVNGTDALQCSNGGSFAATSGLVPSTAMPVGDFIQVGFDGRIWIGNSTYGALYFSDQVVFDPGTKTYSLTYDANNFIEGLSPQDGEKMTGLFRVPRALLVFKENHIYRIYNATSVDPYPAYNVGTFSQESIVQAKDGVYFHHSSGFYKFAYDGQPIEISRRIIDFVKAIPRSAYENIVGIYDGFDSVKWSVGSVTVEGVTYSNCQLRYTISTQVWTIYDYGTNTITAMVPFDTGTVIEQVCGTSAGRLGALDNGTKDFGSLFNYELIDRWRSFTEMYSKVKSVSGVMVFTENAGGAKVQYQTQKSQPNKWEAIDTIKDEWDALFPNANTVDFNGIRFRLCGVSSGVPIIYHGMELLTIQDKGFDQN